MDREHFKVQTLKVSEAKVVQQRTVVVVSGTADSGFS
jgi:hypothetical protein